MATKNKREGYLDGIGPYSGQDDIKFKRETQEFSMGRDISKLVDPSHQRNQGFSAKLDKGPKES